MIYHIQPVFKNKLQKQSVHITKKFKNQSTILKQAVLKSKKS